jgi:hypothetical protein
LRCGLLVGALVYLILASPVGQFVLNPEFGHSLSNNGNGNMVGYKEEKGLAGQSRGGMGSSRRRNSQQDDDDNNNVLKHSIEFYNLFHFD